MTGTPIRAIEAQHISRPVPGGGLGHAIECPKCSEMVPVANFTYSDALITAAQGRITFRLRCGHSRRFGFKDLVPAQLVKGTLSNPEIGEWRLPEPVIED